jgi:hypothetical protein
LDVQGLPAPVAPTLSVLVIGIAKHLERKRLNIDSSSFMIIDFFAIF